MHKIKEYAYLQNSRCYGNFNTRYYLILTDSIRQRNRKYAIYRANRQSIEEMLKILIKPRTIKPFDYFNAIDCALLKRQKPSKNRSPCVSYLPVKNDVEMNIFTRYIDQSGKNLRSKVILNGRGIIRFI